MDIELDVHPKITKAVAEYANSTEKPPFSEEQLVILAILVNRKALSVKEIFDWVLDTFPYYDRLARAACWLYVNYPTPYVRGPQPDVANFRMNFDKVFWRYEVPLEMTKAEDETPLYSISTVRGWQWLAGVLGTNTAEKPFKFFELPPEIRNTIYEYMFQYPKSGVSIVQEGQRQFAWRLNIGARELGVLSRSVSDEFEFEKWPKGVSGTFRQSSPNFDNLLRTKPLKQILAPLATNRQFFQEAMPLFYSLNRFYFDTLANMTYILQSLAPERRKYINHVSFNFYRCKTVAPALRELLSLEGLNKLDINVRNGTIGTLKGTPGLHTLCRLRGLEEVTLHGDCEKIRSRVMGNLLLPEAEPATSKKRKRADDSAADECEEVFE